MARNPNREILIAGVLLVLSGAGCTGGAGSEPVKGVGVAGNAPPVMVLAKILQTPIPLTGPVGIQALAEDPEREPITYSYQWYVDDALVAGQTNPTFPAELLRRGQMISAEITPSDGKQKGKPVRTPAAQVGNTAPHITAVTLTPQTAQPGGKLTAEVVATDPDHDRVDLTYRWFRNDAVVKEGEEASLDTTGLAPRDKVTVEVTARDSQAMGNMLRSDVVTLGNNAPTIVSTPPAPVTPDQYEYAVRATDFDGDRLTYELETAPAGMTIESATGRITWMIPPGNRGVFHVKVLAKDGQGGLAYQEFDLALGVSLPGKPAGA
ncbi:MAG: putative Ig domain-containing protein [Nitrospira sp.]|nr:putative Ig domain-containing protein [Nitrospira sp.]